MPFPDEDMIGHSNRQPLQPKQLAPVSAAVCLIAFSSVEWVARVHQCSIEEARIIKGNAQVDFECMMMESRRIRGRMP